MNRDEIIKRLETLPADIFSAEKSVINAVNEIQEAKEELTNEQGRLLVNGTIDGKNAEIRAAQLRERTEEETKGVQRAENKASVAKANLNFLLNVQSNFRAIAGILKGAE